MPKKGFTVLEITIVLVVVGIIISLAIKGGLLMGGAKIKAELAKLNKIEVASTALYASLSGLPESSDTGKIDSQTYYIDSGFLKETDMYNQMVKKDFLWLFYKCTSGYDADNGSYHLADSRGSHICVTGEDNLVPSKLVCYIEREMDDRSLQSGEGRRMGAAGTDWADTVFNDCEAIELTDSGNYGYRVF